MPLVAVVDGVRITIYADDHPPPHFHARIAEYEALFSIATGDVIEGALPRATLKSVAEWYMAHRDEIAYLWVEIQELRPVRRIDR